MARFILVLCKRAAVNIMGLVPDTLVQMFLQGIHLEEERWIKGIPALGDHAKLFSAVVRVIYIPTNSEEAPQLPDFHFRQSGWHQMEFHRGFNLYCTWACECLNTALAETIT